MFEQESEGGRGGTCSLASMSSRGPPGRGEGEGSRLKQEREAALGREVRGEGRWTGSLTSEPGRGSTWGREGERSCSSPDRPGTALTGGRSSSRGSAPGGRACVRVGRGTSCSSSPMPTASPGKEEEACSSRRVRGGRRWTCSLAFMIVEGSIARSYGVQREDSGYSYRSMVVLDKEGLVVARMLVDLPIGLGVKEALRIVKDTNKSQNNLDMESVEAFSTANLQHSEEVNEADKEEVNTEDKKSLDEKSGQANNVTKETSEMKQEK